MTNRYEIGSLILRLVLGVTFLVHGWAKFQMGLGNVAGFFQSLGLPGIMAYAIATIELIGGIAMIMGLGTRLVATLFALVMLGAIFTAKLHVGFMGTAQAAGYELDVALLAIALYLAINGSRIFSVDKRFNRSNR